jgi:KDO2-lipid IV(A) lauroyltransferase
MNGGDVQGPTSVPDRKKRASKRARGRHTARVALDVVAAILWRMPLSMALVLGEMTGWLAWVFAGAARRRCLENLERALGHRLSLRERRRIARGVFVNAGRSVAETLALRRTGVGPAEKSLTVEGKEHLAAAQAPGRGVLIVTAHYGNFELMAGFLRRLCVMHAVGRQSRGGDVEEFLHAMRASFGVETLGQTQLRSVLRVLRDGNVVGLLPDQDIDRQAGIFVPFFGIPAYTPSGPASLSLASGAPILPCYLRRVGRSAHRLVFLEPIHPDATATDREAEVRRITEAWTAAMEKWIAEGPEQWAWFHRRWKTTPENLEQVRDRRETGKMQKR